MRATKFFYYFLIFIISLFQSILIGEESKTLTNKNYKYEISEFSLKSLREESYFVTIKASSKDGLALLSDDAINYKNYKLFSIEHQRINCILKIEDQELSLMEGTLFKKDDNTISFIAYVDGIVQSGEKTVSLLSDNNIVLAERKYNVPSRHSEIDSQPLINKVFPRGGEPGDTLTIIGKNFSKDLDSIVIVVIDEKLDESHILKEKDLEYIQPVYLGSLSDKNTKEILNEVKFTLPFTIQEEQKMKDWTFLEKYILGKTVKMYLVVNYRPSPVVNFTIVPPRWKLTAFGITMILILILFYTLVRILKTWNFIPLIILEAGTNKYSLSKFQSFLWTTIGVGSYFYIAVCQGIILREGKLPEFSYTLLLLMGISYSGLLASNYISDRSDVKEKSLHSPSFKDLFCKENGEVDMPRLQLFAFTIVAIILYIFNLFWSNALEGLPAVPESLHALLVTSQGGYLGGKYINEKTINLESKVKEKNTENGKLEPDNETKS